MNIIVAVDKNWGIGNKGQQLVNIPLDQQMFREETLGKVIIMGRKTLESLPGKQPLYGRKNIVLTNDKNYKVSGAILCYSMDEVLKEIESYDSSEVFVIGGQTIYEQFLPFCDTAHVTYIDFKYEADTYFPNLDTDEEWKQVVCSDEQTYFDLCYEFRMYTKK